MKKVALITGGTGGIGGAVAKALLELGWRVFLPVRNLEKAQAMFASYPEAHCEAIDLTSFSRLEGYCQRIHEYEPQLDLVFLSAGGMGSRGEFFDHEFPGATIEEQRQSAIIGHRQASVRTKRTVLEGLTSVYGVALKHTVLGIVGSHAADFSPELVIEYGEVGYAHSMVLTREIEKEYAIYFKTSLLEQPGLIRTRLTEGKLADALANPDNVTQEPAEFAQGFIKKTGLL